MNLGVDRRGSWLDCHVTRAHLSRNWSHDCVAVVVHDHRAIVAINWLLFPDQTAEIFGQKFSLKPDVLLIS